MQRVARPGDLSVRPTWHGLTQAPEVAFAGSPKGASPLHLLLEHTCYEARQRQAFINGQMTRFAQQVVRQ
jgi:hypothetical protein